MRGCYEKLSCVTSVAFLNLPRVHSLFILEPYVNVSKAVYFVIFLQLDYFESSRILMQKYTSRRVQAKRV